MLPHLHTPFMPSPFVFLSLALFGPLLFLGTPSTFIHAASGRALFSHVDEQVLPETTLDRRTARYHRQREIFALWMQRRNTIARPHPSPWSPLLIHLPPDDLEIHEKNPRLGNESHFSWIKAPFNVPTGAEEEKQWNWARPDLDLRRVLNGVYMQRTPAHLGADTSADASGAPSHFSYPHSFKAATGEEPHTKPFGPLSELKPDGTPADFTYVDNVAPSGSSSTTTAAAAASTQNREEEADDDDVYDLFVDALDMMDDTFIAPDADDDDDDEDTFSSVAEDWVEEEDVTLDADENDEENAEENAEEEDEPVLVDHETPAECETRQVPTSSWGKYFLRKLYGGEASTEPRLEPCDYLTRPTGKPRARYSNVIPITLGASYLPFKIPSDGLNMFFYFQREPDMAAKIAVELEGKEDLNGRSISQVLLPGGYDDGLPLWAPRTALLPKPYHLPADAFANGRNVTVRLRLGNDLYLPRGYYRIVAINVPIRYDAVPGESRYDRWGRNLGFFWRSLLSDVLAETPEFYLDWEPRPTSSSPRGAASPSSSSSSADSEASYFSTSRSDTGG